MYRTRCVMDIIHSTNKFMLPQLRIQVGTVCRRYRRREHTTRRITQSSSSINPICIRPTSCLVHCIRHSHFEGPVLICNRQISRRHRIPRRSSTRKPNRLMILRNTIRPQHNRKLGRRKTRLIRRNSQLPRIIPDTIISIIVVDSLTNPMRITRPIKQMNIPRPPRNSSTRKRSIHGNPQISRRRCRHRRLQPHTPRTAVLSHRRNRITRRINQTQRNCRLRPHHRGRRNRQNRQHQPRRRQQHPQTPHHPILQHRPSWIVN